MRIKDLFIHLFMRSFCGWKQVFIFLLVITGFQVIALAQKGHHSGYDSVVRQDYPLDQCLVNGVIHKDFFAVQQGHPFFESDAFWPGSVNIGGQLYKDLLLRYDLYRQQVEMIYSYREAQYSIYLTDDPVDAFSLGEMSFRKLSLEGKKPEYYQVIATSRFTCYIHREKIREPIPDGVAYPDETSTFFIKTGQGTEGFKSNRQFLKHFKQEHQVEIRRLFRARSFNFRQATGMEMLTSLNEVSALIESREAL